MAGGARANSGLQRYLNRDGGGGGAVVPRRVGDGERRRIGAVVVIGREVPVVLGLVIGVRAYQVFRTVPAGSGVTGGDAEGGAAGG